MIERQGRHTQRDTDGNSDDNSGGGMLCYDRPETGNRAANIMIIVKCSWIRGSEYAQQ